MIVKRSKEFLISLLSELRNLPAETEWLEFKHQNDTPEEIGEYLSALANSAAFTGKIKAYMLWGIEDNTHNIVGTRFSPHSKKVGNEELESWLLRLLSPKINFHFYELTVDSKKVVILEIGAAFRHPVQFKNMEFIRVGSYKKNSRIIPRKSVNFGVFLTKPLLNAKLPQIISVLKKCYCIWTILPILIY